jgi:uncharacterized protein (TIGR02678 family)
MTARITEAEERQIALQELLDLPHIARAERPDSYRRISRHQGWIRAWLEDHPRWLLLQSRGVYRLQRTPSVILPERGLPRLKSPLAYACLCWILWYAEGMAFAERDWFLLADLIARVEGVADGRFSMGRRADREALHQALQLLIDLGALQWRDGDLARWVQAGATDGEDPVALFEFTPAAPRLLATFAWDGLPQVQRSSLDGRALVQTAEAAPPLSRAWRALLLGPALWRGDDPEGFAALLAQESEVRRRLEQDLGWSLWVGAEWAAVWRAEASRGATERLLDLYPESGDGVTERPTRYRHHPLLLLLGEVQAGVAAGVYRPDQDGALALSAGEIHELLGGLAERYRSRWGAEVGALDPAELTEIVLTEGRRFGFLRGPDRHGRCWLLPAAAFLRGRYPEAEPHQTGRNEPEPTLAEPDPQKGGADDGPLAAL